MRIESNALAAAVFLTLTLTAVWATLPGWTGKRAFLTTAAIVMAMIDVALLFVAATIAALVLWGFWHADDFAP